jgi:hypothetical protein
MILPFSAPVSGRRRHARNLAGEIVIFPGVRVEYHEEAPKPKGKDRSRRKRRKSRSKRVLSA